MNINDYSARPIARCCGRASSTERPTSDLLCDWQASAVDAVIAAAAADAAYNITAAAVAVAAGVIAAAADAVDSSRSFTP